MTQIKAVIRAFIFGLALVWAGAVAAASGEKGYVEGDMALGPADAPVTVIEYASMTCPHCASFHNEAFKDLKEKYIDTGKVRMIFREFPLDGLALRAAMLARCTGEKRFFGMIDVLFKQQSNWSRSKQPLVALAKLARLGGMSQERFDACISNDDLATSILQTSFDAREKYEVQSTPSFVVNGNLHSGFSDISDFDEVLAKYLP